MSNKTLILEAVIDEFNEKGLKFTMDDLAKRLGMSKKTIYTVFNDKKDLLFEMADYCFDNIKESEARILNNKEMDVLEKIRQILTVLPDKYKEIDFTKMFLLKDKYPQVFAKVEERIETGWEATIGLLEQGIREKKIRPINIQVLKMMIEATLSHFLASDILDTNGITYCEALEEMNTIIMNGIVLV